MPNFLEQIHRLQLQVDCLKRELEELSCDCPEPVDPDPGNHVTNTSELVNDGADGSSTYVETADLPVAFTHTSGLTNNGEDGTSTYVELDQLEDVAYSGLYSDLTGTPVLGAAATSNDYNDLDNTPVIPTIPANTSDFVNDGADTTSTYVEHDELNAVATTGDYNNLSNTPASTIEFTNQGADNTSTYVEHDELNTVATSGDYNDLSNTPAALTTTNGLTNEGADNTSTYVEHDELNPVALSGDYGDLTNTPPDVTSLTVWMVADYLIESSVTFSGILYLKNTTAGPLNVNTEMADKLEGEDTLIIYPGEAFTIQLQTLNDFKIT